ncbi:hypothetical protein [Streptomyces vinaceus]|uniref:hypothetical protein n=1 Tax=Streptomyces vinaceus TaxID=1960 RepID=UPI0036B62D37
MSFYRLGDIVVDGQRSLVGRICDFPDESSLMLERPPGNTRWTADVSRCYYASEEEARAIEGPMFERVIGNSEKPVLGRGAGLTP